MNHVGVGASALTAVLALAAGARAEPPSEYPYRLDAKAGIETGVIDVTTTARVLHRGVDEALARAEPASRALAVTTRATALVLVDLPIAAYELVLPHEIFGHGARLREFGTTPSFHIEAPLPYNFDPEYFTNPSHPTRPLFPGESAVVYLAGLEAETVQQRHLVIEAFQQRVVRRGEAFVYMTNELTHIGQILAGSDLERAGEFAAATTHTTPDDYTHLVRATLVAEVLDPMFLLSLERTFVEYVARGRRTSPFPELRVGPVGLFVTSRIRPVPWGVEHHTDVLVDAGGFRGDVTLRIGGGPGGGSFGVDLSALELLLGHTLATTFDVSAWTQPGISSLAEGGRLTSGDFGPLAPATKPGRIAGAAAHATLETRHAAWFLGTRLGGKSAGLVPGQPLAAGADVALIGGTIF